MFSKFVKSAAVAFTLSASLFSSNAAAAPWTFTTAGVISSGYDWSGIFGNKSSDLTGLKYSMTTIVDPLAYAQQYTQSSYGYRGAYGVNSGTVIQKITVGGVTATYSSAQWSQSSGQSHLENGYLDQGYQYSYFTDGSYSNYVSSYSYVYSFDNEFINSLDFAKRVAYTTRAGDYGYASFSTYSGAGYTYFSSSTPSSISINEVPEPAPLALFGLGLVALAFARRKNA